MRILFVASLHHPEEAEGPGPRPGDTGAFPVSQAQHFWVRSLSRLGHECGVFWRSASAWPWARPQGLRMSRRMTIGRAVGALASSLPAVNPDYLVRNRNLLLHARHFRPDVVVLLGGNQVILPRTLKEIKRERGAVLVYACGTSPGVFGHPIERSAAALYDLVIANDRGHALEWQELGAPRVETLPMSAADPGFHYRREISPAEQKRYASDVAFVGTLVPSRLYARRVEALEGLRGFDLAIWSIHEVPRSLRAFYRGPALGEEMMRALSASKIVVNPHGDFMRDGGNMRLFEACGAGVLQLTDDLPGVRRWFTVGTHLLTYGDPDQLASLASYYLSHPDERQRIAGAGQAHVYAHHTFDRRMTHLMDLVAEIRGV